VQTLNDIEYIQLHPDEFLDVKSFNLEALHKQVAVFLDSLTSNASACVTDVKACKFNIGDPPEVALPQRRPVNLDTFQGTWNNTNSSLSLQHLDIEKGDDPTHVKITGSTNDNHVSTVLGTWNDARKAIEATLDFSHRHPFIPADFVTDVYTLEMQIAAGQAPVQIIATGDHSHGDSVGIGSGPGQGLPKEQVRLIFDKAT